MFLSAGKIKFIGGFLCFRIILYFRKAVNEINLWKNYSSETPNSKLRKDSLSKGEENGSLMLISILYLLYSPTIAAGWLTWESLVSSNILLLTFW